MSIHPDTAYELARRGLTERRRQGARQRTALLAARSAEPVEHSTDLATVLRDVGVEIERLGALAYAPEMATAVRRLVAEISRVAHRAGCVGLPHPPRRGDPAVVGYRTLAKIARSTFGHDIEIAGRAARRIERLVDGLVGEGDSIATVAGGAERPQAARSARRCHDHGDTA